MADALFPVQNLFYLGAYQRAINEAQDLVGLSEVDSTTRDVLVYRSYIALGSAEVRRFMTRRRQALVTND